MPRARTKTPELPPFLTTQQFAALYQISTITVNEMCRAGRVEAQKVGRDWRIKNDFWKHGTLPELRNSYVLLENEAAALIGVTDRMVRYLCTGGILPFKWAGGSRRFAIKDIYEYVRKKQRKWSKPRTPRPPMMDWARKQFDELAELDKQAEAALEEMTTHPTLSDL
jgi:excisionase family DNA binding protein